MSKNCIYGFGTEIALDYDAVVKKIEQLLSRHGFQIYTRLELREIIGHVLDDHVGRYVILGACNPQFAKDLFLADPDIGMLMPCNLIVYELKEGFCRVMVKDPARIMDLISNPVAIQAAINVKEQMEQVIEELDAINS